MPLAVLLNPDDPIFAFEHMMRHREYFAVMRPLDGFSVLPYLLDPARDTEQPALPWNLNHQQAHNDFNLVLPNNNNNGFTLTTVTPPAATGVGTSTGTTSLVLTGVTNTVLIGAAVTGTGVPAGTTIIAQVSGPVGKDGTYTTNHPTTLTSAALTMTHPPYQQANAVKGFALGIHAPGILLEGQGDKAWWSFLNHQQHFVANSIILPLPTQSPLSAGTGPGQKSLSNPWWWAEVGPVNFPYW